MSCIFTYEALEGFFRSRDGSLLRYPFHCTAHPFDVQVLVLLQSGPHSFCLGRRAFRFEFACFELDLFSYRDSSFSLSTTNHLVA
jgi:hypothetical protein